MKMTKTELPTQGSRALALRFHPVKPRISKSARSSRSVAFWTLWIAVVALVATACGTGVGTGSGAVSVGDETLSRADLTDFALEWQNVGAEVPTEEIAPDALRQGIEFWIQTTALEAELGDGITSQDRVAAQQWAAENFASVAQDSSFYDRLVAWRSSRLAIGRDVGIALEPSEAEMRERLEIINTSQGETVCAAHILVATADEADSLFAEIEAGGDFAALALASSLDTGSAQVGGDLGCAPQGTYVGPFDEAVWAGADGDLIGPIQTEFGFHIIQHQGFELNAFEFDEVQGELRQLLIDEREQQVDEVHRQRRVAASTNAKVALDPRYGTFESETGTIFAPEGAEIEGASTQEPGDGFLTE